jgi:hypothetical protein
VALLCFSYLPFQEIQFLLRAWNQYFRKQQGETACKPAPSIQIFDTARASSCCQVCFGITTCCLVSSSAEGGIWLSWVVCCHLMVVRTWKCQLVPLSDDTCRPECDMALTWAPGRLALQRPEIGIVLSKLGRVPSDLLLGTRRTNTQYSQLSMVRSIPLSN